MIEDKLKKYIKEHKLTQRELAQKLNVNEVQVNRWLNGRVKIGNAWGQIITKTLKI